MNKEPYDFEESYKKLIDSLFEEKVTEYTIAPILGLNINSEIKLDASTNVRLMRNEEISAALTAGLSSPYRSMGGIFFIPNNGNLPCLELKAIHKKHIGQLNEKESEKVSKELQRQLDEENEKLNKFRQILILLGYKTDFSGTYKTSGSLIGFGGISYSFSQPTNFFHKEKTLVDIDELKKYWKIATNSSFQSSKALSLSLRRLGYSSQRFRIEDKILDLLIAAEAFYMADEDDERGDIGYRLKLRAAFWYQGDKKRQEIINYFSQAYRLRGKIAHGKDLDKKVKISDVEMSLEEFVELIEGILIEAIKKALKIWKPNTNNSMEWNKLILGNK